MVATPIMRWLLERGGPIDRFHQAMLLQVPAGLREEDLICALQAVLDHHDALRLRLDVAGGSGELKLEVGRLERWRRSTACGGWRLAGLMLRGGRRASSNKRARRRADFRRRLGCWCRRFGSTLGRRMPGVCL
jgi:hypothetical protein